MKISYKELMKKLGIDITTLDRIDLNEIDPKDIDVKRAINNSFSPIEQSAIIKFFEGLNNYDCNEFYKKLSAKLTFMLAYGEIDIIDNKLVGIYNGKNNDYRLTIEKSLNGASCKLKSNEKLSNSSCYIVSDGIILEDEVQIKEKNNDDVIVERTTQHSEKIDDNKKQLFLYDYDKFETYRKENGEKVAVYYRKTPTNYKVNYVSRVIENDYILRKTITDKKLQNDCKTHYYIGKYDENQTKINECENFTEIDEETYKGYANGMLDVEDILERIPKRVLK